MACSACGPGPSVWTASVWGAGAAARCPLALPDASVGAPWSVSAAAAFRKESKTGSLSSSSERSADGDALPCGASSVRSATSGLKRCAGDGERWRSRRLWERGGATSPRAAAGLGERRGVGGWSAWHGLSTSGPTVGVCAPGGPTAGGPMGGSCEAAAGARGPAEWLLDALSWATADWALAWRVVAWRWCASAKRSWRRRSRARGESCRGSGLPAPGPKRSIWCCVRGERARPGGALWFEAASAARCSCSCVRWYVAQTWWSWPSVLVQSNRGGIQAGSRWVHGTRLPGVSARSRALAVLPALGGV